MGRTASTPPCLRSNPSTPACTRALTIVAAHVCLRSCSSRVMLDGAGSVTGVPPLRSRLFPRHVPLAVLVVAGALAVVLMRGNEGRPTSGASEELLAFP